MKEYTEVLTFFFMNIQFLSVEESVWKLCQSNSLFQVALCQYFNIAINGMKFFLFYCQRWKWSYHSFRWCLCSCGFSPLQENACGTEGIEWGIGKMGLLFQIILTSYLLSIRGILRNTGPRSWSSLEFPIITFLGVDMDFFWNHTILSFELEN